MEKEKEREREREKEKASCPASVQTKAEMKNLYIGDF